MSGPRGRLCPGPKDGEDGRTGRKESGPPGGRGTEATALTLTVVLEWDPHPGRAHMWPAEPACTSVSSNAPDPRHDRTRERVTGAPRGCGCAESCGLSAGSKPPLQPPSGEAVPSPQAWVAIGAGRKVAACAAGRMSRAPCPCPPWAMGRIGHVEGWAMLGPPRHSPVFSRLWQSQELDEDGLGAAPWWKSLVSGQHSGEPAQWSTGASREVCRPRCRQPASAC